MSLLIPSDTVRRSMEITEGIAGASRASAKTKLYVNPKVVLPKTDTIAKAMRLPRPDLMNPPESQKAMAMSHLQAGFLKLAEGDALDTVMLYVGHMTATDGIFFPEIIFSQATCCTPKATPSILLTAGS